MVDNTSSLPTSASLYGVYGGASGTVAPSVLDSTGLSTPTTATPATATSATTGIPTSGAVTSYGNLRFPADIDAIDHWLQISIWEYSRENRSVNATRTVKGTITLPLPASLPTRYGANYESAEMSDKDIATEAGYRFNASESKNKSYVDRIKDISAADVLKGGLGLARRTSLDTVEGIGAQVVLGRTRNPCLAAIYKGADFRTHTLSYKFAIRTQAESDTLQSIIRVLKYAMSPDYDSTAANFLFKYPDECEVDFHYPQYLFKIGPSVFKHVALDYHGAGVPAYFQGSHAPVEVSLEIELMETNIVTKAIVQANNY